MINNNYTIQALLLDFDGVVVDTEPQYSIFWGEQGRKYRPDIPHLEQRIKGQTLQHILETYFGESKKIQEQIVADLYTFEAHMKFEYVPGLREFITDAKALGLKSAIVTSSDNQKMSYALKALPELNQLFDAILTAEHFENSKPAPDGYLAAAALLNAEPSQCIVFEDSFNGIESGKRAGMIVVGLSTTNDKALLAPLCQLVIPNFEQITMNQLESLTDI